MVRNYSTFGATVRQLRTVHKMSLRALASCIDLDYTYLSKIENGHLAPPSEATIRAISTALSADPDELIRRSGKIPSDVEEYIMNHPDVIRQLREHMRAQSEDIKLYL